MCRRPRASGSDESGKRTPAHPLNARRMDGAINAFEGLVTFALAAHWGERFVCAATGAVNAPLYRPAQLRTQGTQGSAKTYESDLRHRPIQQCGLARIQ